MGTSTLATATRPRDLKTPGSTNLVIATDQTVTIPFIGGFVIIGFEDIMGIYVAAVDGTMSRQEPLSIAAIIAVWSHRMRIWRIAVMQTRKVFPHTMEDALKLIPPLSTNPFQKMILCAGRS